jgi:hypothetical protein
MLKRKIHLISSLFHVLRLFQFSKNQNYEKEIAHSKVVSL